MPKMNFRESGPYASSRQRVRDQDIVPVRLHAHDECFKVYVKRFN